MTTDQRVEPEGLATKARAAVGAFRDFAREHGMDFRQRDPLVMDIHKAIDALASHAEQADALARLEKENADLSAQLSGVCDDAAHTERELTEAEAALTAIKVELDDWKGRAERQYDYNVEIIAREAAVIAEREEAEAARDALQKELAALNAALAERETWRRGNFGLCAICGTTVWHTDGCIQDERGVMHPLCPIDKRAKDAEAERDALTARVSAAQEIIDDLNCCECVSGCPAEWPLQEDWCVQCKLGAALTPPKE